MGYISRLFVLLLAINSAVSIAEITSHNPTEVCFWLAKQGIPTRKWDPDYGDGTAGCASNLIELKSQALMPNNIAYYVRGEGWSANKLKLMLNVNDRATEAASREFLLNLAIALIRKASGEQIPPSVGEAIVGGLYWSQRVGVSTVKVEKIEWPTNKGYEIQVTIE